MPHLEMVHLVDPAQEIWDRIGDISNVQIAYSSVLLGIYIRPEKTKSGLHLPDNYRDEDKFQGKVCLVLKKGPMAFQNTDTMDFGGFSVNVGDWVVIRPSDGWAISIHKTECRMVSDTGIRMVIKNPDDVW